MTLHDAWASLRHGGNLLSIPALDGLPARLGPTGGPGHEPRGLRAHRRQHVIVGHEHTSRGRDGR